MILRITDGVDTADFDSNDYSLSSWAPSVADEGETQEQLVINILNGQPGQIAAPGSDTAFLANLAKLRQLLRNAQAFSLGDPTITPVLLEWTPGGGTFINSALITAWDDSQFYPPTVNAGGGFAQQQLNDVTLNITRRAPWTDASAEPSTTSASVNNPSIHTVTLSAVDVLSPLLVRVSGFSSTATPLIAPGYLFVAARTPANAGNIQIAQYSSAAGDWSLVADVANQAVGNLMRYTPSTTNKTSAGTIFTGLLQGRISTFAVVRNNSATATYLLSALWSRNGAGTTMETKQIEIAPSNNKPWVVYLGQVSSIDGFNTLALQAQASATGAGTLDINIIPVIRHAPGCYVIPHGQITLSPNVSGASYLEIDPRFLTGIRPRMAMVQASDTRNFVQPDYYRGDIDLRHVNEQLDVLWVAPYTLGASAFWRHVSTGSANAATAISVTARRYRGADVPQ